MVGILVGAVDLSYLVPAELSFAVIVAGVILALIVFDLFFWGWRRSQRQAPTDLPTPRYDRAEKHPSKKAQSDQPQFVEW